jgi:hypothetical protein
MKKAGIAMREIIRWTDGQMGCGVVVDSAVEWG